ncbi:LysR family transcriptional regulator [Actinosynnema sp. ALI-1.44]|uniref:LysR family transcriptional regulator n=1 Tax=Actinosynnema sp. ALI-1.44 TaxID=1933779 RepID=UPI00097BC3D0|nr:LysR family transcriptional regulator [Actinosynnema sp. ALI-1.44]ONI76119.1 LysR family transcriptional regulator [Actinosynnema sp. ALI-1.44]
MHLDLNLLVTLDALLDEGSVTAAAERLYLTQPAMSRALGRIRRATGDQILVRSGRTMLPTPYAEQIRDEVHQLVTRAQAVLTPATEVDPATLERTFTLQCNDVVIEALTTRLAADLAQVAPGVCLRVLSETDAGVDEYELRRGRIDFQITNVVPTHADARSTTVLTDELAVIGRRDLPQAPSSWGVFTALPHVVISRRGSGNNRVDDLLKAHKLSRKVAFTVPTLALALRIVAAHELITVAPRLLTEHALPPSLRSYPMPEPTSPIPAVLAWHARHDRDAAHRWLRSLIADALGAITRGA